MISKLAVECPVFQETHSLMNFGFPALLTETILTSQIRKQIAERIARRCYLLD